MRLTFIPSRLRDSTRHRYRIHRVSLGYGTFVFVVFGALYVSELHIHRVFQILILILCLISKVSGLSHCHPSNDNQGRYCVFSHSTYHGDRFHPIRKGESAISARRTRQGRIVERRPFVSSRQIARGCQWGSTASHNVQFTLRSQSLTVEEPESLAYHTRLEFLSYLHV